MAQDNETDRVPAKQSSYQLYDPTMETTYSFSNQKEAIAKAKELGASRFQQVQEDGSVLQINVSDAENDITRKQSTHEPIVLQEPSAHTSEISSKEPLTSASKTPLQTVDEKHSAPSSIIEPDPNLKFPDRDDPFSRPNGFDERFVVTQRRNAQDLYRSYEDRRPAIEDQGDSLRTKNADRATAMDMIELAAHRGWSKMNVKGPEEFRREMWIEGQAQGIEVRGYRPSDKDRAEAERRSELVGYRVIERADEHVKTQPQATGLDKNQSLPNKESNIIELPNYDKGVRGIITAIGDAPYKDREGASLTPFIEMNLADGRSHKIWGVGIPSMVSNNKLTVGEEATISSAGRKPVTLEKYDKKSGKMKKIETFRREWSATDIKRTQAKIISSKNPTEAVSKRDEPQITPTARGKQGDVIDSSDPRITQDRATELEDRMKSTQAARDPDVRGAASKLSLMEAELKAQGIDRADVNIAVSNARTQMSKELASGKNIPVEKLANVSRQQEERAKVITGAERNRTVEREKTDNSERTPSR